LKQEMGRIEKDEEEKSLEGGGDLRSQISSK
jgi:hypothetical protein